MSIVEDRDDVRSSPNLQTAWIVFSGETDIAWLKIFKAGFRHCFVLLNDGERWMSIDPISPYLDVQVYHHISTDFNLPNWLESRGHKIIQSKINKKHKTPAPWMVVTCVELVKRVLGLHKRFIFTPWQLYCFLSKQNNEQQQIEKLKGKLSWVS